MLYISIIVLIDFIIFAINSFTESIAAYKEGIDNLKNKSNKFILKKQLGEVYAKSCSMSILLFILSYVYHRKVF